MDTSQEGGGSGAVPIRQVTTWRLERLGMKSLTASHDFTNAFGSVEVGGGGPSCSETVGTELPSLAAEVQAGDHDDPGHGWRYHAEK